MDNLHVGLLYIVNAVNTILVDKIVFTDSQQQLARQIEPAHIGMALVVVLHRRVILSGGHHYHSAIVDAPKRINHKRVGLLFYANGFR